MRKITQFHANIQRNGLGVVTLMGFSQIAQSKELKQFMIRGKDIASKHVEIFSSIMREDDLPVPIAWNVEVTDNIMPIFSDKIMMFQTTSLIAIGIGYYGMRMSVSPRRDIGMHYSRLIVEIMKYSEDGANIMIENGWMEQPPQSSDRDKLTHT